MLKLLSVDGVFIINIKDIFMIKSHGNKTSFYINGLEKPIIIDSDISNVIGELVSKGFFKNMTELGCTQYDAVRHSLSILTERAEPEN